jgi:hypothetical protein
LYLWPIESATICDGRHKQFDNNAIGKEGPGMGVQDSKISLVSATKEEPTVEFIHQLARDGLSKMGHHGPIVSMGCPVTSCLTGMIFRL